eukprot:GHVO01026630.1.p1 GENE.GHVO01026630.1~~GHVO01026630.1.p1  ORF type:complete len:188 (-),score=0.92 GHVO01026630.1:284-847(-)
MIHFIVNSHFLWVVNLVVFFAFTFPFTHIFMVFAKASGLPPCQPEFSDYSVSIYSTFLVMLNSLSLSYSVESPTTLAFIHFTFTFLVPIMLINFLIALFSNTVALVTVDKDIFVILEKLALASTIQSRVSMFCPYFRRLLLKMTKHCFVELDGQVCVKCVSSVSKSRSKERVLKRKGSLNESFDEPL